MATINYKGLTGKLDSVTVALSVTIDQLITAIAVDEGLATEYYTISKQGDPTKSSLVFGDSSTTLNAMGFVDGDTVICTTNQYGSKQERQIEKLEIAKVKRAATGRSSLYDINLLPNPYNGNLVAPDDGDAGPLNQGRPWLSDTAITIIETAASGAELILNLDSRNINSLARTGTVTTWYDLTDNNNDATIYGTVAYGLQGGQYCAVFPGGDANYVQALSGAYFTGTSFTVQSWVYVTAVLNWNRIFDFGNGASSNNVLLSNTYGVTGKPGIYIEGGQFQSTYPGASTVLLNAWHQICCTFEYTSGPNGTATIYIDGQPHGSGTLPKPVNIVRNNCYIGKSNWGNPPDPNMQGGIGSLQIYNGFLTAAEMLSNYNTTKSYYGL